MKPVEFEAWAAKLRLSDAGRTLIERIRSSPPSRRVKSSAGNVSGTFPSAKMGVTIQFESHTLELALIHLLECDDAVLEYYDQPEPIPVSYWMPNGRKVSFLHTPDFFVLKKDWAGWIEAKPVVKLEEIHGKAPKRISKDRTGRWICPPCIDHAESLGLGYRIVTDADVNPTLASNLALLRPFQKDAVPRPLSLRVECLLGEQPGMPLRDVTDAVPCTREDLLRLVSQGRIHVDLMSYRLDRVEDAPLFLSAKSVKFARSSPDIPPGIGLIRCEVGVVVAWNEARHTVVHVHGGIVSLENSEGAIQELKVSAFTSLAAKGRIRAFEKAGSRGKESPICAPLPKDLGPGELERIVRRQKMLAGEIPPDVSLCTLSRWRARMRHSEAIHGNAALGLAGKQKARGNRNKKLPAQISQAMADFIEKEFENLKAISARSAHLQFTAHCQDRGLRPPSEPTFRKAIAARDAYQARKKREGGRGAYGSKEFHYSLLTTTPRHGEYPLQIAHVDHTELDVELIDEETGESLGRPWLTLMVDAFSRRILALALLFDPPSVRSCMLLVRDCVARHGRFPSTLVVDGGKEFQGIYFEGLLAMLSCTKKVRPPAEARNGSVVERMFGVVTEQFIHNLRGNTKLSKRSRVVTKETDPKRHAVWTLRELHGRLEEYFFEVYDILPHSKLLQSPRHAFEDGMKATSVRVPIVLRDETFLIMTYPEAPRGSYTVHPTKGVQVEYLGYWNDLFRHADVRGKKIPVRCDPFDISKVYAYARNSWVICRSWNWSSQTGTSEKELRLASITCRKKLGDHPRKRTFGASVLAHFLRETSDREILLQRRRDRAQTDLFADMEASRLTFGTADLSEKVVSPEAHVRPNPEEDLPSTDIPPASTERIEPFEEL